jgi:tetratricopeptide (TPR) repeat protein
MEHLTWSSKVDKLMAAAETAGLGTPQAEEALREGLELADKWGKGSKRQARILLLVGRHGVTTGHFDAALSAVREGGVLARASGGEPTWVAPAVAALAAAARERNAIDAVVELANPALALQSAAATPEALVAWAQACHAIGAALLGLERWNDAAPWFQGAAERWQRSGRGGSAPILAPLGGLAAALEKAGRRDEAIEVLRRMAAIHAEHVLPGSPALLAGLAPLGSALAAAGRAEEALEVAGRVRAVVGHADAGHLDAQRHHVGALALSLLASGQPALASELLFELNVRCSPADDAPGRWNAWARAVIAAGVTDDSCARIESACAAAGLEPASTALALAAFANAATIAGRPAIAKQAMGRASAAIPQDPDEGALAQRTLATASFNAGDYRTAAALSSQLASTATDPVDRATHLLALGRAHVRLGRLDEAAAVLDEALVLASTAHGGEDLAGEILGTRADLERREDNLRDAERLAREALERRARVAGEDSWQGAHARIVLAHVLHDRGVPHEAALHLRRAAATLARVPGADELRMFLEQTAQEMGIRAPGANA